jgi:hypothetical protein
MLTKDQIFAANDRPREWVAIPEWTPEGESHDPAKHGVWVTALGCRDRDGFELSLSDNNLGNLRARLAVLACVDENGKRIFADDEAALLGDKSTCAVESIFHVAARLNKLTVKDDAGK